MRGGVTRIKERAYYCAEWEAIADGLAERDDVGHHPLLLKRPEVVAGPPKPALHLHPIFISLDSKVSSLHTLRPECKCG